MYLYVKYTNCLRGSLVYYFFRWLKNTKKEQTRMISKSFQNLYRYLLYETKV